MARAPRNCTGAIGQRSHRFVTVVLTDKNAMRGRAASWPLALRALPAVGRQRAQRYALPIAHGSRALVAASALGIAASAMSRFVRL